MSKWCCHCLASHACLQCHYPWCVSCLQRQCENVRSSHHQTCEHLIILTAHCHWSWCVSCLQRQCEEDWHAQTETGATAPTAPSVPSLPCVLRTVAKATPVLAISDPDVPFDLATDSCGYGIGANFRVVMANSRVVMAKSLSVQQDKLAAF